MKNFIVRLYNIVIICLINNFLSEPRPSTFSLKRRLLCSIGYEIGNGTKIVGPIHNTGKLMIGSNCWIGANLTIHGNGTVIIEDNCDLGPDVTFLTGGHTIGESDRRAGIGETYSITVCKGTWIGARSTIVCNTTIGESVVVAACSCVVKDIPSNKLVGGVPARIIRNLD